jgi:hypothetical protein
MKLTQENVKLVVLGFNNICLFILFRYNDLCYKTCPPRYAPNSTGGCELQCPAPRLNDVCLFYGSILNPSANPTCYYVKETNTCEFDCPPEYEYDVRFVYYVIFIH